MFVCKDNCLKIKTYFVQTDVRRWTQSGGARHSIVFALFARLHLRVFYFPTKFLSCFHIYRNTIANALVKHMIFQRCSHRNHKHATDTLWRSPTSGFRIGWIYWTTKSIEWRSLRLVRESLLSVLFLDLLKYPISHISPASCPCRCWYSSISSPNLALHCKRSRFLVSILLRSSFLVHNLHIPQSCASDISVQQ